MLNSIIFNPYDKPSQPQSLRKYKNLKLSSWDTAKEVTLDFGKFSKIDKRMTDEAAITKAIYKFDYDFLREVSTFYSVASGIYSRLVKYLSTMYRFDWYVTPHFPKHENPKAAEMMAGSRTLSADEQEAVDLFYDVLDFLDRFEIKKHFLDIANKVVKNGVFYGYLVKTKKSMAIQELPTKYCRSSLSVAGKPAVEFNLAYFDEEFPDAVAKERILNLFPKEFSDAYKAYKEKKIDSVIEPSYTSWHLLNSKYAFKINTGGGSDGDMPPMISVVPAILELAADRDLGTSKLKQELVKILIQQLPLDKNFEMVFDEEEAKDIHINALQMVSKATGLEVLTTFADTSVESLTESGQSSVADTVLTNAKENVFDEAGVSQLQFNSNNSVSLEKSIANDEASLTNMILQLQRLLNDIMDLRFNSDKVWFEVQILPTTIYNYRELSKMYKEQTQLGFSKMLPQIALGNSQSSILANAKFENEMLQLWDLFIPPLMSSTMSGDFLNNRTAGTGSGGSKSVGGGGTAGGSDEESKGGRPSNESKGESISEKTAANRESQQ